ncbi:Ribosomal protein S27a [Musa troglodytarum]|uniref:Ribosomal protein S27a n=1 Tax=Musa troglodytarum TaxID=320322 RepID=A0A9E7GUZ2_9LILI|nr:Ribosomal protein S27a [Musa troglodytarum]
MSLKLEDGRCGFLSVPLGANLRTRSGTAAGRHGKSFPHHVEVLDATIDGFDKVDDATGKVTRLRKECPNAECGAGTFMANHFDRHYCGKCGLTYVYQKAQGE